MNLSSHDVGLLTEIANIGASRAVSRLSLMLHDEIDLINPEIMVLSNEQVMSLFSSIPSNKPHITQNLSGIINGVANFIFEPAIAPLLLERLFSDALKEHRLGLEVYEREALQEVTNLVVSTYFASLANLCEGEIKMSIPKYSSDITINECLPTVDIGENPEEIAVIMNTEIRIKRKKMGNLIVVLTTNSSTILVKKLMGIIHDKSSKCR